MSQRNSRFRSGDIAENLGMVLVQGLALVAPVPRSEDVGLDVVATLLEYVDSYKVKPRHSFYIQLKSAATRSICFEGEEVEWLMSLQLPFFIGSINTANASIDLFACHELSQVRIGGGNCQKLVLHLDKPLPSNRDDSVTRCYVGPPVHSWSVSNISEREFIKTSFDILNPHLENANRNLELGRCGRYEVLKWTTSQPPEFHSFRSMIGPDTLIRSMNLAMPYLATCLQEFQKVENVDAFEQVLGLVKTMHEMGCDIDRLAAGIIKMNELMKRNQ